MSELYVITGSMGSGKTPVIGELRTMGYAGVDEPARRVIAEQQAIDATPIYDRDPSLFFDLMLEMAIADYEGVSGASGTVFFDRGIPDLIGHAELFGFDRARAAAATAAAAAHRYEGLVFVLPPWREIYTTDEDRRMTFEQAAAFGERVSEIYDELGYQIIEVPKDSVPARAKFIVSYVTQT